MTNNPYRLGWVPDLAAYPRRPVYAAIADAMADAINSGKLQAGMKLPPRRLLAYTLGLNLGTVHKAYALAARKGLVSGETGRGTFVRGPLSKGVSWPNENPYERRIDFCDNYPCLIRHADPIRKQLSRLASDPELDYLLQYQQNSALGRHKLTAVSWLKRFRIDADPDQTILTNGALHAGFVALLTLCRAGDTVLTEEYTSQAIKGAAERLKLKIRGIEMDEGGIIPKRLEDALRKGKAAAAYFVPTLQNPTATTLSPKRRREIARILTKYGVPLIEDDIFAPLLAAPPRPISHDMPDLAFYIAGLSKALAPAFRLAFLKTPKRFYSDAMDTLRLTTWMASPLLAEAANALIVGGDADRLIERQRQEIRKRQEIARDILKPFACSGSAEAMHLWLKLPEPWRATPFCESLREKEVLALPSPAFATPQARRVHAVRLCLGTPPTRAKVSEGLRTIRDMLAG